MDAQLRAIIVAASEDIVSSLLRRLRRGGFTPTCRFVSGVATLHAALIEESWDLVLCEAGPAHPEAEAIAAAAAANEPPVPLVWIGDAEPAAVPAGALVDTVGRDLSRLNAVVSRLLEYVRERNERQALESELERQRGLLHAITASLDQGVYVEDAGGRITSWNLSAERLLGWSAAEALGHSAHDLFHAHAAQVPGDRCPLGMRQRGGPGFRVEERFLAGDGSILPVDCMATPLFDEAGYRGAVVAFTDLRERRRLEEDLLHHAFRDPLTALPNRALFRERLGEALLASEQRAGRVAVMFLDVDRFRVINNSLGHNVGDELLVEIGRRLAARVGSETVVARFGGDEFTVLLEHVTRTSEATSLAELLIEDLRAPFLLGGREVFITASIGIVFSSPSSARPGDLLRDADAAMHQAKAAGRARYAIFQAEQNTPSVKRLDLETDLWRALQRKEIEVYYQPTVDLANGAISGVEALARWQHPRHGLIPPAEFVPLAEEMGVMLSIGRWVLEQACRQTRSWQYLLPEGMPLVVSVNLSSKEFQHPDLLNQVAGTLRRAGLDPRSLKLEITEGILMEDAPATLKTLRALKRLGVQLAIDDFGTGYSSFSYLRRFPVDTVKIDRSFVAPLRNNRRSTSIVRAVTALAHDLGMTVTAEGIETAVQLACLRDAHVDWGQGFFYSPAVPPEAITAALDSGRWSVAGGRCA